MQHFLKNGFLLKSQNYTFVILITKSKQPSTVDQFGPISLCNVTYKIISKILAIRLKPLISSVVFPFQMSFVPSRNIHDNITSHEIIEYMIRKKEKGLHGCKDGSFQSI